MTRTVGLGVLIVALLLAWQSYSVWSMLQSCSIKAHAIIAAADPLDREPPDTLKSVVEQNIPLDELLSYLATVLLDRYNCGAGTGRRGTEWLIDQPSLAWHLRTTFGKSEVIALFAVTADMGKGDFGLSKGARWIYRQEITQLDESALRCLVRRALGKVTHNWLPKGQPHYWACLGEGLPPPT